jgi:hypothetical protein
MTQTENYIVLLVVIIIIIALYLHSNLSPKNENYRKVSCNEDNCCCTNTNQCCQTSDENCPDNLPCQ